jgi:hypothetical protein
MSSRALLEIIQEAPSLVDLSLVYCDSLFMTGFLSISNNNMFKLNLQNLTSLSLSKNRYLTDFLLNLFIQSAPNLTSLDISYCCLTKNKLNSLTGSSADGSNVMLTLENLTSRVSSQLISVDLSGIDMFNHNEASLINLLNKLPNLEEVHLANLPTLKAETVSKLCQLLPKLKQIDLSNSIQDYDSNLQTKSVECLFKELVNVGEEGTSGQLEVIKLNKAKINNPQIIVENIGHFKSLRHLDLSNAVFRGSFGNLKRLNGFIESFASSLAQCVAMEFLSVSYCEFLINDTFIRIIAPQLKKLKHLDLRNCSQITDKSLHYLSIYSRDLEFLDVSWCQGLRSDC